MRVKREKNPSYAEFFLIAFYIFPLKQTAKNVNEHEVIEQTY
jgi:hypothetical protein